MQEVAIQEIPASAERFRYGAGGGEYRFVATPAETAGQIFAFVATEPPGGGPPLHIHRNEDEFFLVLDGEVSFFIDGQVLTRTAGGSAFVRRGLPHCFKNCSGRAAKLLVLFTPGQIEGFFDYGMPVDGGMPSEELMLERLVALAPEYGLEVVGPSPL